MNKMKAEEFARFVLWVLPSEEKDPAVLIDLIIRINQAFEESRPKSRTRSDASASFHSVQ